MKRIVIAGGSGFLGQVLAKHFLNAKADVVILTRSIGQRNLRGRQIVWDARSFGDWQSELEGADALINLTGKSVNCRYTERNRQEILNSRVDSTQVLGEALKRCANPPPVWLNASTATLYRHTFREPWDENGIIAATKQAKDAFSVEVGLAWEQALESAVTPRTRKIALRAAMVLGLGENSVFPMLRRLTKMGLGGRMGTGQQIVSWIHQADFCRAVEWLINQTDFEGPVNIAAPNPVTNREMMQTLREICKMPFGAPAAQWMLEIGAFALRTETELIIKSRNVVPRRLSEKGFEFRFPKIRDAFEELSCVA